MNITELNHSYTPPELASLNAKVSAVLSADAVDTQKLVSLINQRDTIIRQHLSNLSDKQTHDFAEAEYRVNQILLGIAEVQAKDSLSAISGLIRGKRAAGKYG